MEEVRMCSSCRRVLPIKNFYKRNSQGRTHDCYCKACRSDIGKQRYENKRRKKEVI